MTLTLRGRLVLMLVPVLALLVILGSAGLMLLSRLGGRIDAILRENYDSVIAMQRLRDALDRIDSSFQFTLSGEEVKARAQYQDNWEVYRDALRFKKGNITLPGEQELVEELTALTEQYQKQGDAFYARARDAPYLREAYFGSPGLLETANRIKSIASRIAQINHDNMEQASRAAKRTATVSLFWFGVGLALALVLTALAGWYTFRTILKAVRAVTRSARGVSAGNLDQVVPYLSHDALGALAVAFNQMTRRLRKDQQTTQEQTQQLLTTAETLRRELSQREAMEQALRRSEANLNRAQAVAHIGSWYLDVPRNELVWSEETYSVFEIPPGTPLSYETFLAAVHPDDRAAVDRAWTAALNGAGYDIEHRIVVAGGTRWVREKAELERDAEGKVRTGVGIVHDITERKLAEERLRRSNRALTALSTCNQVLIRATEEADLLQQVCRIVVEKAGYRLCWVGYAEQDESKAVRPVAQAGYEEGYLQKVNITWADAERGRGPTGTCIRTGRPAVFQDTASDPRFLPWRAEALKRGYASCVGIPLIAGSTTLGALTIYAAERDAFGGEEVELLTELADDLAFGVMALRTRAERKKAIELHAAHERETRIGFEIQQTLLLDPVPVDLPGLQVAALTVPSRQVDGDFYHFYQHEDGSLDVIVADVMGKGIPAAILGAGTKSQFLKALAHLLGTDGDGRLPEPREIVTLAHAEMGPHLIELESFVTLCYARIDPNRGTLDLVDCGHTGLIHRHASTGACETVHGDNLALGMREGETFEQMTIPFETGDLLLLFSDGITETRSPQGDLFGEGRLVQCVQANSGLSPEDLVKEIRRATFAFSGAEVPGDDLTCVAVLAVERQTPPAHPEAVKGVRVVPGPWAETAQFDPLHLVPPREERAALSRHNA